MSQRDAAIRQAIARVRESLDELETLLDAKALPSPRRPRRRPHAEPTMKARPEVVDQVRRRLRSLGVVT